jgi:AcrR family transcriptional regulator
MAARPADVVEIRSRDADRTQQEILAAATAEFAAHGFGGGRIEAIAERAGVNKKLIYYYFEGKDELFLAVLEQTYADIRAAERELHLEAMTPLQAIESLVVFTWRHYLAHPEFLALLNSENMQGAGHLKRSPRIRQMNSPLIDDLAKVLKRGEKSGELRGAIDAMQLYISIAGLAYFYLSNKHTLGTIFGRDLMAKGALDERLAHMTAVVVRYVQA